MIKKTQIVLGDNEVLDVNTDISFGVTYQIDDVKNPEKRNSSHSKTIKLPGTKNNNIRLGGLFDVNSDFSYFNPNIRTKARIVVDSTTILDGYLQLLSINKSNKSDLEGDVVEYNVVIFDENVNVIQQIGEQTLDQLDLSEFDHAINKTNITDSWTNNWEDGYVYPMMHKNGENYYTSDWKPAVFHKQYLTKIFDSIGYTITGSFLDDLDYANEIIPFVGDYGQVIEPLKNSRKFRASYTGSTTFSNLIHQRLEKLDDRINMSYADDSTFPNFDNAPAYDTSTGIWTVPATGYYTLTTNFTSVLKFDSNGNDAYFSRYHGRSAPNTLEGTPYNAHVRTHMLVNNQLVGNYVDGFNFIPGNSKYNGNIVPALNSSNGHTVSVPIETKGNLCNALLLKEGDEVDIRTTLYTGNVFVYLDNWRQDLEPPAVPVTITLTNGSDVNQPFIYNEAELDVLMDGDIVNMTNHIPKKIKQKDILVDLIKRYNLYIRKDPNNDKVLILDSRDAFYGTGDTLDWTDKKDYDSKDTIKLLSDLQFKEMLFTYKNDDKDEALLNYKNSTGDVYGQKEIEFTNEFKSSAKVVESPFSPTATVYNSTEERYKNMIVPFISTSDPNITPRVLYYGGLKDNINSDNQWNLRTLDGNLDEVITTQSQYPYAGHFNDPYNPTIDNNFGTQPFYYWTELNETTDNTLYNRYWKNYVEQIGEGKLITSKFKLSEVDIQAVRNDLNTKIFVKDSYYYINKIVDYDPYRDLTEVELLKMKPFVTFVSTTQAVEKPKTTTQISLLWGKGGTQETRRDPFEIYSQFDPEPLGGGGGGVIPQPIDGVYNPGPITVVGGVTRGALSTSPSTNLILSEEAVVSGRNNMVAIDGESLLIAGDNNTIDNEVLRSGILGGSGNRISVGVENSWIIGRDDTLITESNTVWVGELKIVDGVVQNQYNLIEGGDNMLRNRFPSHDINLIEAGDNEIRAQFPKHSVNLING